MSRSASGEIGKYNSFQPSLSSDGKKLVFASSADNLIDNDTNGVDDIFLKDLTTGAITRLSQTAAGVAGDDISSEPLFSPDGKKVYFVSDADNFVPGAGTEENIYVKNLITGSVELVAENARGMTLSADGRKMVFHSGRIDTGVNPGLITSYVKDLVTGAELRISEDLAGIGLGLSALFPQISPDGNLVAFTHLDLAQAEDHGDMSSFKIYIKDLRTGVLSRGDLKSDGTAYDGVSGLPKFTPDGQSIVFYSYATDLGVGSKTTPQIYKRHLATGEITKLSVNTEGDEADSGIHFPDVHVTYDGKAIVFTSDASNLVEHDQIGVKQLFVRKMVSNGKLTAPSSPLMVSAVQDSGSILVSFDPSADDGGAMIREYTVTSSPGGITTSGSSSPILMTGLTPGESYTFTVTATNTIGESLPSDPSASVVAPVVTVPGAPVLTSAVDLLDSILVSFDPPADDGGSVVTGYTVTSSPGGITTTGGNSPILMTGLTSGVSYTFTVTATNAIGESSPSNASVSVMPSSESACSYHPLKGILLVRGFKNGNSTFRYLCADGSATVTVAPTDQLDIEYNGVHSNITSDDFLLTCGGETIAVEATNHGGAAIPSNSTYRHLLKLARPLTRGEVCVLSLSPSQDIVSAVGSVAAENISVIYNVY